MKRILLLADSNNIACRASYVSSHEAVINMDFSILDKMIHSKIRLLHSYGYDNIETCFTFDEAYSEYIGFNPLINRRKLIDEYKGTRPTISDPQVYERDCWIQAWMQKLFSDGENVLSYPGAEADDYIGFVSKKIREDTINDIDVAIWSGDKDLLQCLSNDSHIYAIRRRKGEHEDTLFTEDDVFTEKGVPASKIRMQLALQGDAIDNYKGVRGYGGKKGLDIINDSNTIDDIIQILPKDSSTLKRNWNLAGIGREYLDDRALERAMKSISIINGPKF
jgi:5'-3' exonuclease